MKKLSMLFLSTLLIFLFAGCSTEEQSVSKNKDSQTTKTSSDSKEAVSNEPIEPTAEDVCYFCNMKIYTKNEGMGTSTAQAIKKDGTHVFFDDSGCLLNASRKYNEKYTKKWVRDYVTSNWIEADKAVVVKADVATPMKYGYVFFANEKSANTYIHKNKTNGAISDWTAIDTEAKKRYKAKMQKEADMNTRKIMDNTKMSDTMK